MKTSEEDNEKTMMQLMFIMFLIFLIIVILTSHTSFPSPSQKRNAGRFPDSSVGSEATQLQGAISLTLIFAYSILHTTLV